MNNYTFSQKIILTLYTKIFSASNTSLKKYSRNLYLTSALLLLVNIISLWAFGNFESSISQTFDIEEANYEALSSNFNLTINFLEIGLGLTGALLDFTPTENNLGA